MQTKTILAFFCLMAWASAALAATCKYSANLTCTHFIDEAGSGSACSEGSPCTAQEVFDNAGLVPGDVVCVNAGTYQGASNMLHLVNPTDGVNGTASQPITVCSLDGPETTVIDGQGVNRVLYNVRGDYIHWEGLHVKNPPAQESAIWFSYSGCNPPVDGVDCMPEYNALRFMVVGQENVGGVTPATQEAGGVLLQGQGHRISDSAGYGFGRKLWQGTHQDDVIGERLVLYWTGSAWTASGKTAFDAIYHGFGTTYNNIFTFMTNEHTNNVNQGLTLSTNGWWLSGDDWWGGGRCAPNGDTCSCSVDMHINGSLFFVDASDYTTGTFNPGGLAQWGQNQNVGTSRCDIKDITINDSIFRVDNSIASPSTLQTITIPLRTIGSTTAATDLDVVNVTTIGGKANDIGGQWTDTGTVDVDTVGDLLASQDPFTGSAGGQICYRYNNRTLTSIPLWPLPIAGPLATILAAHSPSYTFNINDKVETVFGAIPAACKTLNVQSCEIGTVDASTLVINWQNDIAPPLNNADNAQFAVEYDASPQTENSTVIVGSNQTRTAMASAATAGQTITVDLSAAAVRDSNYVTSHAQSAVACANNVAGGPAFSISQVAYRFNTWDDAVDGTDYLKQSSRALNTDVQVPAGTRLVYTVAIETDATGNVPAQGFRLQRSTSKEGAFADLPAQMACGSGTDTCALSHPLGNQATSVVIDPDAGLADVACQMNDTSGGIPSLTLNASEQTECRYAIQIADDASVGTTECFRAVFDDGTAFNGGYGASGANIGCLEVVNKIAGSGW